MPALALRPARFLAMLVMVAGCSDGVEPSPRGIGGVWTGPVTLGATASTLVLWLPDSTGAIDGVALLRPRASFDYAVTGTFSGSRLTVEIRPLSFVQGFDLDVELDGDRLDGTVINGTSVTSIRLDRTSTRTPLAGLWVLTSLGGEPVDPDGPVADTLRIGEDTRVAVASHRAGCSYWTVGMVTTPPGRAAFEYFWTAPVAPCSQFFAWDTLVVTPQQMIRRRETVGGPFEEVYERR